MPECHTCAKNGLSWPGCLQCKGPSETNHKGQTFVSIDATRYAAQVRAGKAGQTLGEVLASTEAINDHEPDALDLDTDGDGEKAAFVMAECTEIDPDTGEPGQIGADPVAGLASADPGPGADPEPESPFALARKLAFVFTELSTEEFDLVRSLMRGETMADYARRADVTRACISARVRTLARKHPAFKFLCVGKNGTAGRSVVWPYHGGAAGGRHVNKC